MLNNFLFLLIKSLGIKGEYAKQIYAYLKSMQSDTTYSMPTYMKTHRENGKWLEYAWDHGDISFNFAAIMK